MRKKSFYHVRILLLLLPALTCAAAFGQQGAYTVPSKVYVGDPARLILPLPGFTRDGDTEINIEITSSSPDIIIHRTVLERRPAGNFLTIAFSAYRPGMVELPPVTMAGTTFRGLTVEISSIFDSGESAAMLSGPALPPAIPGTSFLVYGSISGILLLIVLVFWVLLRGQQRIWGWLAVWRRKRLFITMSKIEKRLRRSLARGAARREILDTLSAEFRSFLTYLTGENCRSMTALEISLLTAGETRAGIPGSVFLGGFFDHCDAVRFNGREISGNEVLVLLDDVRHFLAEAAA